MFTKKNILLSLLYIFSITLGFTLGKVNLFELISGAVKLNLLLFILAVVLVFFTSICLFLLEMTKEDKMYMIYTLASLAFGLSFFIASLNVISTLLTPLVYFWFLQFTYSQSSARALILTKFLPGEIFMPVLRQSFTYLLIYHRYNRSGNKINKSIIYERIFRDSIACLDEAYECKENKEVGE